MAVPTEIERLVVRIVGDATAYLETLKKVKKASGKAGDDQKEVLRNIRRHNTVALRAARQAAKEQAKVEADRIAALLGLNRVERRQYYRQERDRILGLQAQNRAERKIWVRQQRDQARQERERVLGLTGMNRAERRQWVKQATEQARQEANRIAGLRAMNKVERRQFIEQERNRILGLRAQNRIERQQWLKRTNQANQQAQSSAKMNRQILLNQATRRQAALNAAQRRQDLLDRATHKQQQQRDHQRRQNLLASARQRIRDQKRAQKETARIRRQEIRASQRQADQRDRLLARSGKRGLGGLFTGISQGILGGVVGGGIAGILTAGATTAMSMFGSIFGMLGSLAEVTFSAFTRVTEGVISLAVQSVQAYNELEQAQVAFETMTGSAQVGQELVKQIQIMAAETPLTSFALQQQAKVLLQYGVSVENILPTLRMLGDVAGGNAQRLRLLTLGYAQVQSAGRLLGTEVRQLAESGWNPLEQIAKKTGLTMAELRDQMSAGIGPSARDVTIALIEATSKGGRFFNMMNKQAQTIGGLWSTFSDNIYITMQEIGRVIVENFDLKTIIRDMIVVSRMSVNWVQNLGAQLGSFAPIWKNIRQAAIDAWEWMGPIRQSLMDLYRAILQNSNVLWNAFTDMALGAWDRITGGAKISWATIQDAIVDTVDAITFFVEHFDEMSRLMTPVWKKMWNDMYFYALSLFIDLISRVLFIWNNIDIIEAMFKAGTFSVKEALKNIVDKTTEELDKQAGAALEKAGEKFLHWSKQKKMLRAAQNALAGAVTGAVEGLTPQQGRAGFKLGSDAGRQFNKGMASQIGKFDTALFFSQEALSRISEFLEGRGKYGKTAKKKGVKPTPPLPEPAGLMPTTGLTPTSMALDRAAEGRLESAEAVAILTMIEEHLKQMRNKSVSQPIIGPSELMA